jgi:hypothetical protein
MSSPSQPPKRASESKNMRELKELLAPKPVAETPPKPDLEFADNTATRDKITFFKPAYRAVFTFVPLVLLLLACMARWPYGFYIFLRFVVCASAIYMAVFAYVIRNQFWIWMMVGIAILFNPLVPIYLSRSEWGPIDMITAMVFAASIFKLPVRGGILK